MAVEIADVLATPANARAWNGGCRGGSSDMNDHPVSLLAGPSRVLPDLRAHEVFEQRVRACPDQIAAAHGDRQLTYGELNTRANQLAPGLLGGGVRARGGGGGRRR